MKLRKLAVAASLAAIGLSAALTTPAFAAEEQFFPVLAYRTGAYAPNGTPWANGFVDYLKLTSVARVVRIRTGEQDESAN